MLHSSNKYCFNNLFLSSLLQILSLFSIIIISVAIAETDFETRRPKQDGATVVAAAAAVQPESQSPPASPPSQLPYAPVIRIRGGRVFGRQVAVENGGRVFLYQAIRYGRAQRFAKAIFAEPWHGLYNATYPRDACPHVVASSSPITMSDDCLYLSVWRPRRNHMFADRAVLVYFEGESIGTDHHHHFGSERGSPPSSSSFSSSLDARFIADIGDAIVITVQYRSGVFGYLYGGNATDSPGNLAIHDQILALKWIHRNVARFGGDRTRVTIVGHGTSAAAVGRLIISPLAARHFRRAIMQSGAPIGVDRYQAGVDRARAWRHTIDFARRLDCNYLSTRVNTNSTEDDRDEAIGRAPTNTEAILRCLRAKSLETLLAAIDAQNAERRQLITASRAERVGPIGPIFGDDALPLAPSAALLDGKFNYGIDLLFGVNRREACERNIVSMFVPESSLIVPFGNRDSRDANDNDNKKTNRQNHHHHHDRYHQEHDPHHHHHHHHHEYRDDNDNHDHHDHHHGHHHDYHHHGHHHHHQEGDEYDEDHYHRHHSHQHHDHHPHENHHHVHQPHEHNHYPGKPSSMATTTPATTASIKREDSENNNSTGILTAKITGPLSESTREAIKWMMDYYGRAEIGDSVLQHYDTMMTRSGADPRETIATIWSDMHIVCPTILFAQQYALKSHSRNFYAYRLSQQSQIITEDDKSSGETGKLSRCDVDADVRYLFSSLVELPNLSGSMSPDPADRQLTKDMIHSWASFARTGQIRTRFNQNRYWLRAFDDYAAPITRAFELDFTDYRMIANRYNATCNHFWRSHIFA